MKRFPSLERARKVAAEPEKPGEPTPFFQRELADPKRFAELNPVIHAGIKRDPWVLKRFGLTPEAYAELAEKHGGRCAICGGTQKRELAIDHCHKTGKVRALLCGKCNIGLGHFKDDPELLRKAAAYLESR